MLKKILILLTASLVLLGSMASCGNDVSEAGNGAQQTENDETVPDTGNDEENGGSDEEAAIYAEACSMIENGEYEEARTALLSISSYSQAREKLKNFVYVPKKVSGFWDKITGSSNPIKNYQYDEVGNATRVEQLNADGALLCKYTYEYDEQGSVTLDKFEIFDSSEAKACISWESAYAYENGAVSEMVINAAMISPSGGSSFSDRYYRYYYDDKGRVIKSALGYDASATEYQLDVKYSFYENGKTKTLEADEGNNLMIFRFDEQGRLTESEEGNRHVSFTYGTYGLSYVEWSENGTVHKFNYAYDATGVLNTVVHSVYSNGEMQTEYTITFSDYELYYSENVNTQNRANGIKLSNYESIIALLSNGISMSAVPSAFFKINI